MKTHYEFKVVQDDLAPITKEFYTLVECITYLEQIIKSKVKIINFTIESVQNKYRLNPNEQVLQENVDILFYTFVIPLDSFIEYIRMYAQNQIDLIREVAHLRSDINVANEKANSYFKTMKNSEEVDQKLRNQIVSLACSLKEKEIDGVDYFIISKSDYINILNKE